MNTGPSFLPEVKAQWRDQLELLQKANEVAQKQVNDVRNQLPRGGATEAQFEQAQLDQLEAAQKYNSFLELDRQYIRMAMDAETRNQQRNLTIMEHMQLATTRETMYALSAEFTQFKTESQASLLMLSPVQAGGHTYYTDGRVEWNNTLTGMAGQAWEGLKDLAAGTKDSLIRGPFTPAENYAICQSALGGVLPELVGVMIPAPGGRPGSFLWDEALGQSLGAADPAGDMCRIVYPKGTSPRDLWIQGGATEGGDAAAGDAAAQFVPLSVLDATVLKMFADVQMQAKWDAMVDAVAALTGQEGLPRWGSPESWSLPPDGQGVADAGEGTWDAGSDVEAFAPGIAADQLWYRQMENDAAWNADDSGQFWDDEPWFDDTALGVDGFAAGGGQPVFGDQVDALWQAMVDFSPRTAAPQALPVTPYAAVPTPVLASNWT
ncbi:MAG: hypothetical protein IBJ04_00485 [Hydrogenophaga sp.]|uniref:hypothetical protein n=1 Tax=Hydrogenophaga sp. TaxID=1904254 RepID=UPI00257FD391|nr:hypothetical protein [Hydrogenophaga sp.]MBL0942788.1 hypothetical protein [Hydrogenophaga sp.]